MTVRCSKCGEELLGAVNRCWKCGQTFALRPEIDGRPPIRPELPPIGAEPLEAIVLDEGSVATTAPATAVRMVPTATPWTVTPSAAQPTKLTTADLIDARRASLMAVGGMVGALVLGAFSLLIAPFSPWGCLIALIGLAMGIWGLSSPRRNLSLLGMLICCLAIGLGAYTGVWQLYVRIQQSQPIQTLEPDPEQPES
jgi:hypothetical protein